MRPCNEQSNEHRVGTATLGLTLVGVGILHLINLWHTLIPLEILLRLWPLPLLILGAETLLSLKKSTGFVIDVGSLFLTVLTVLGCLALDSLYLMLLREGIRSF